MMFGRPMILSLAATRDMPLPHMIDDEELTSWPSPPGKQPVSKASYNNFFFQALKLIQIVGDVLEAINSKVPGQSCTDPLECNSLLGAGPDATSQLVQQVKTGDFHEFLRLDAALSQWHADLPAFLKVSLTHTIYGNRDENPNSLRVPEELIATLSRQAKALQARYVPR